MIREREPVQPGRQGGIAVGASRHLLRQYDRGPESSDRYPKRRSRRKLRSSAERDLAIVWTAHEVRAPVLAVRGAIERVMARAAGLGPKERLLLRRSADELTRLAASVESLLSLSMRPLVLHPERTNLVRLVREAVASCTVDGGGERVWLRTGSSVHVVADPTRLRAAIANVIRNALAYSPSDTPVVIEVRREAGSASILIKDAGPGIDADEQESIFEPFVRGGASESVDGIGVGLTLTKQIIEAHRGTIVVFADGSGSIFELRLKGVEA